MNKQYYTFDEITINLNDIGAYAETEEEAMELIEMQIYSLIGNEFGNDLFIEFID